MTNWDVRNWGIPLIYGFYSFLFIRHNNLPVMFLFLWHWDYILCVVIIIIIFLSYTHPPTLWQRNEIELGQREREKTQLHNLWHTHLYLEQCEDNHGDSHHGLIEEKGGGEVSGWVWTVARTEFLPPLWSTFFSHWNLMRNRAKAPMSSTMWFIHFYLLCRYFLFLLGATLSAAFHLRRIWICNWRKEIERD